jgi:6-phosphogluconate dehydrogenase
MPNITVLGLGAMGSRMAANLFKAGHSVTVWNRTPAAAEELVTAGARLVGTPKWPPMALSLSSPSCAMTRLLANCGFRQRPGRWPAWVPKLSQSKVRP